MALKNRVVELRHVKASELRPNPKNWRRHTAPQRRALRELLGKVGFAGAALAREVDGGLELIDGHLRAEEFKDQLIPTLILDVSEEEADLLLTTFDPLGRMAETDQGALALLLERVTLEETELLMRLQKEAGVPSRRLEGDLDAVLEPPKTPVTKRGDLWVLGDHRLLCGDATEEKHVRRLVGDERPRLMVTDPPYGVDLAQIWRDRIGINRLGKAQADPIPGDKGFEWAKGLGLVDCDVAYVWHASIYASMVESFLEEFGFEVRQQIVWVKTQAPLSRQPYHWKHEPCWFAVRRGRKVPWVAGRDQVTVWEAASPKHIMGGSSEEKFEHPTQKPVLLYRIPISNHLELGEAAYDPFVGSGSAIAAAEAEGRRCLAMEIEPKWCDVAVERWENLTGGKAKRGS
jgi:DNA modification methylase